MNASPTLRAALFDLDGTLIDREPLMTAALAEVVRAAGLRLADEEASSFVGRAWPDVHRELDLRSRVGWSLPELLERVFAAADRLQADGFPARVLPGGTELVARLATSGVPVALVTGSTRAEAEASLHQLGVRHHVSAVFAAEDYAPGKPDPAGFLAAARALGVADHERSACVVFEDSDAGIASARAAGMRVVATAAANAPPYHPAHQRLVAAHVVVGGLDEVDDSVLTRALTTTGR